MPIKQMRLPPLMILVRWNHHALLRMPPLKVQELADQRLWLIILLLTQWPTFMFLMMILILTIITCNLLHYYQISFCPKVNTLYNIIPFTMLLVQTLILIQLLHQLSAHLPIWDRIWHHLLISPMLIFQHIEPLLKPYSIRSRHVIITIWIFHHRPINPNPNDILYD